MRKKAVEKIKEYITDEKKVINIEKSIYNWCIDNSSKLYIEADWENKLFKHLYTQKVIDVLENLKNTNMKEKITCKELLSKDVGYFKYNEYNNEKWKPIIHETNINENDGIFQCKKCKSKKTTYFSLQTRSADEPMTNFITCLNCNNRWKM